MNDTPLVSIIIPVYNRHEQVWHCLRSIQLQELEDFEAIIVDDGSTDETKSSCLKFCESDARFHYFYQENHGVSYARNHGLRHAKGKWITFIDSDNALMKNHFSILNDYETADDDLIIVSQDGGKWNGASYELWAPPEHSEKVVEIKGNENVVNYLFGEFDPYTHPFYPVWNKFFRREIIENSKIRFIDRLSLGEDQVFVAAYLKNVGSLKYIDRKSHLVLSWDTVEHLGNKLREPDNFWLNEYENYVALNSLALSTPSGLAKKYAINYLYDRPLRHILRTYTQKGNITKYSKKQLKSFFFDNIIPIFEREYSNIEMVRDNNVKMQIKLLLSGFFYTTYYLNVMLNIKNSTLGRFNGIKRLLRKMINGAKSYALLLYDKFLIFKDRLYVLLHRNPKIVEIENTLEYIKEKQCSVVRYGDGEFKFVLGQETWFQPTSPELKESLTNILLSSEKNIAVCLMPMFGKLSQYEKHEQNFWTSFNIKHRKEYYKCLDMDKTYYNSFISRCYMPYKDKNIAKKCFSLWKEIWNRRDLLIVEGEKTRLGVGNDLFDNAKSIKRILAPNTNAFEHINELFDQVTTFAKSHLILLALGPTATVLGYRLAKAGYWAIDIGHIDIEYEWYLRKAKTKIAIPGKYVIEAADGRNIAESYDLGYLNEIVYRIPEKNKNT